MALTDLMFGEKIYAMGYHIFLGADIMAATDPLLLADVALSFVGGDNVSGKQFSSVGDLDGDGIEDLSMSWSGEVNGIYNADYTSIFMGAPFKGSSRTGRCRYGTLLKWANCLECAGRRFYLCGRPSMRGGETLIKTAWMS